MNKLTQQDILDWLQQWFADNAPNVAGMDTLPHDVHIFDAGWIDSLAIIHLVMAIESAFAIQFNQDHFQDRRFPYLGGLTQIIVEIADDEL